MDEQHLTREEWNDISRRLQEPFDPSDVDEIEVRRLIRFVHINPSSGCWDWMGAKTISGYGKVTTWDSQGRHDMLAHRWTWELRTGPIQGAVAIDHLCRNRACCNPSHLELVTYGENNRRAWAARPVQTQCKQGHDYEVVGWHVYSNGRRACQACYELAQKRTLARQRDERHAGWGVIGRDGRGLLRETCRNGHVYAEVGWIPRSDHRGRRCRACLQEARASKQLDTKETVQ